MELIITIKEVLAVQLGNAASTQQVPPAYHHRNALTPCSPTAGCTLQVAGGCRPTLIDVYLMPVARQSSAAACWQAVACPVHPCVYAVVVVAAWEQVRLHRNLESGV